MAAALWDLFEKQKLKGLTEGMRQTLLKLEKSGQANARWFNAMGEVTLLEKNYTLAARFFQQALARGGNAAYELNLANALFYARDIDGAKRILAGYLSKHPNDIPVLGNLVNCHLELGELADAKDLCRKALDHSPGSAVLWNCLGQAAYLEGDFEGAREHFDRAYSASPDYVDALYNRANMQARLGRREEALKDFQQCFRKDENHEQSLQNMAVVNLELGSHESAKECIRKALQLNPGSAESHYILGRIHLAAKEFRQARDAFHEAMKVDADHVPSHLATAKLHILGADSEQASAILKRLADRKSLKAEERESVFALLLEAGEYAACVRHLAELPEEQLQPELSLNLIISLWKGGQVREAIAQLEKHLTARGESAETLTLLGMMLTQNGADSLAEARFRKALGLDPAAQGAAFELARILLRREAGEDALEVLRNLAAYRPDDPDCLYNLACCHARNRNFDDSLHFLKKALEKGFHDLDKISGDEDLADIRQFKEYGQLAGQSGLM